MAAGYDGIRWEWESTAAIDQQLQQPVRLGLGVAR